jgi:hypothetical protein
VPEGLLFLFLFLLLFLFLFLLLLIFLRPSGPSRARVEED